MKSVLSFTAQLSSRVFRSRNNQLISWIRLLHIELLESFHNMGHLISSLANHIAEQICWWGGLQASRNGSQLWVQLAAWGQIGWKFGVWIVTNMEHSLPYINIDHESLFCTPHLLSKSFVDPTLKSRLCILCKLPPDNEIDKKLDIIFARLASNPNQYQVMRLLLNFSALTTDTGPHLFAPISPFPIPYPIILLRYHLCYNYKALISTCNL